MVGLGNPGAAFTDTRHNVGASFVSFLASAYQVQLKPHAALLALTAEVTRTVPRPLTRAQRASVGLPSSASVRLLLCAPTTFMNASGSSARRMLRPGMVRSAERLLVVYDDVDLQLGVIRVAVEGGSHSPHNGLRDVVQAVGARVLRVRIGVRREGGKAISDLAAFVLGRFTREERALLQSDVFPRVRAIVEGAASGDLAQVRTLYQGDGSQVNKRGHTDNP